jgi:hypothetical protein
MNVNGSSNGVTDRNIFGQSLVNLAQSVGDESAFVLLTSASVQMMSASVQCTWNMQEVTFFMLMLAWRQHGDVATPEVATCHSFFSFLVDPWTNEKVPHGSPYSHVVDHIVMWHVMWQADTIAKVVDGTLTWQVTVQVVDVAQWLDSTWPSHGMPCGSGKMPNEGPRTKFQKKKWRVHQIWQNPPDLATQQIYPNYLQSWWNHNTYIAYKL